MNFYSKRFLQGIISQLYLAELPEDMLTQIVIVCEALWEKAISLNISQLYLIGLMFCM